MKYLTAVIFAVIIVLPLSCYAEKSTDKKIGAATATVFIAAGAITGGPLLPVIAAFALNKAMHMNLSSGRRYKKHTKSGR